MIAAFFDSIPAMIVLTGVLVGAASSLIGVFLVLRGSAMLTDAISHAIVFGIIVVWLATRQLTGPVQLIGAGLRGSADGGALRGSGTLAAGEDGCGDRSRVSGALRDRHPADHPVRPRRASRYPYRAPGGDRFRLDEYGTRPRAGGARDGAQPRDGFSRSISASSCWCGRN